MHFPLPLNTPRTLKNLGSEGCLKTEVFERLARRWHGIEKPKSIRLLQKGNGYIAVSKIMRRVLALGSIYCKWETSSKIFLPVQ